MLLIVNYDCALLLLLLPPSIIVLLFDKKYFLVSIRTLFKVPYLLTSQTQLWDCVLLTPLLYQPLHLHSPLRILAPPSAPSLSWTLFQHLARARAHKPWSLSSLLQLGLQRLLGGPELNHLAHKDLTLSLSIHYQVILCYCCVSCSNAPNPLFMVWL